MDLELSIINELRHGVGIEDLEGWLRTEPHLQGRVRRVDTGPILGQHGAMGRALTVAITGGGALSALLVSLKAWLAQHPADVAVALRMSAGETVVLNARSTADHGELSAVLDRIGHR
jgi:hypothetical protein